jgi:hypothetical protein
MTSRGDFDRATEDVGNIVALEHVNTAIPDQRLATVYYVSGLGLTRDPYMMTGIDNMWVNAGRCQFHLPTADAEVVRGVTGLVVPDLAALGERLARVAGTLAGTRFAFSAHDGFIDTVSPWGNRIRCHSPAARFGAVSLGIAYVELDVPGGTAAGIGRFYRSVMGATVDVSESHRGVARVSVGAGQDLVFRETTDAIPDYDGHHIQLYVADFSGPHAALAERSLITRESNRHQYLFDDIVDPDTGAVVFRLQHEIRSLRHPLHARSLVNRNPAQTNLHYSPGSDAWNWTLPPADG